MCIVISINESVLYFSLSNQKQTKSIYDSTFGRGSQRLLVFLRFSARYITYLVGFKLPH